MTIIQGVWGAACAVAALRERASSGKGQIVTVQPTGLLRPLANGTVDVIVEVAGQKSCVRVEVVDCTKPQPVSFRREMMAALSISGCNGDPGRCVPGATLPVSIFVPDTTLTATLDGASYRTGCVSCNSGFFYQTSGSVTLPPLAPTATATGRFTITGTFGPQGMSPVTFSGSGSVTLYLHSPGTPGWPNSWWVDRAVLRLDSQLPEPWLWVDVGAVGTAGSTSGTTSSDGVGQFTVDGAGGDIWGTSDAFQFALIPTT